MNRLITRISELKQVTGASVSCGWMCDEVAFLLYALVKFYRPEVVIQTGHLWGKSICCVLEALTDGNDYLEYGAQRGDPAFSDFVEAHRPTRKVPHVISVDPGPMGVPHSEAGLHFLEQHYGSMFQFCQMASENFFSQRLGEFAKQRIMGIVDGDHTYDGCMSDLLALGALRAGMIVLDDTRWIKAIDEGGREFARRAGYDYCELPLYNGIAVLSRKGAE